MLQVFVVGLLFSFAQISAGKQWNFTEAYAIINSIEQRLGPRPSHKDFIPLLHDIKRQLFNFETTFVSRKDNVLKPHSIMETKASNREFIEGEETMYNEEGVDTFKGQKVIRVDDDVEGRLGKWFVLTAMEKLLDFIPSNMTDAERICRPGPLHDSQDESGSTTVEQEKKCLILGDSISIGYFGYVADLLEGDCTVHHAPWSGDGGSLDTSYLLKCLPIFLSSSVYEPVHYDAIIFNSGLHDINCCGFPKEYVPLKKYAKNMREIKKTLLKTGAMIAFATSTPVPYNKTTNEILQEYNKVATKEMERDDPIDIVDLYKAVIEACDGVALRKCDLYLQQPQLHLEGHGYMSLAKEVSKGFKSLLKKDTDERKRRLKALASKEGNDNTDSRKYCLQHTEESMQDVRQLTGCPANTTCCINEYSNSFIGCCMLEDAMDCGDSWHCCPKGTVCDPTCSKRHCSCREAPWESKATRTSFSTLMKSLNTFWKKLAKQYS